MKRKTKPKKYVPKEQLPPGFKKGIKKEAKKKLRQETKQEIRNY